MNRRKHTDNLLITLTLRYFDHDATRSGAELAYFFLFAMVPSLIFLNALVGIFRLDLAALLEMLTVIPEDVRNIMTGYLSYLETEKSTRLMITGLAFSFFSAIRAVNVLTIAVNRAYSITHRRRGFKGALLSALFTCVLMAQIFLSLLLLVAGSLLLSFLGQYFEFIALYGSLWSFVSFAIVFFCGLVALTFFYLAAPMKKITVRGALPGAFAAETAWLIVSGAFSFYASHMSHYASLYGSLGAVMVLMLWFFLTGVILVMGGELNAVLEKKKKVS